MKVIKYRPFYALAAACGLASAILIGTPALGKQPIKPTPKPAANCCDYDAYEPGGSSEYPQCIETIAVFANGIVSLKAFDGNEIVAGHWSANWGTITTTGQYSAPSFLPPGGFDTVRFVSQDGPSFSTSFQIIQQPGVPFTIEPDGYTYQEIEQEKLRILSLQSSANPVEIDETDTPISVEVDKTDSPYLLYNFEPNGTTPLRNVGGTSYAELSTKSEIPGIVLLAASPTSLPKNKKCGVLPEPNWKNNNCTNGTTRAIQGPTKIALKGEPQNVSTTVAVGGSIAGSGGNVSITVTYFKQHSVAYYYKDVYKCKNGQWVFDHTKICRQDGAKAWAFDPSTHSGTIIALALGYDLKGYKFDWLNPLLWECKKL